MWSCGGGGLSTEPTGWVDASGESSVDASTDANGEGGDSSVTAARPPAFDAGGGVADASDDTPEGLAPGPAPPVADCGAGPDESDCGASAPACDFASCPRGCCDDAGICQSGTTAAACGAGSAACQACPPGLACAEHAPGIAERGCECNFESCPTGCCRYAGAGSTCEPGTADTACGTGGFGCESCPLGPSAPLSALPSGLSISLPNATCVDQQCVAPPPTCPFGCVDALGVCLPGAADANCGYGGETCTDCTAADGECVDQQCQPSGGGGVCNERTCPSGCCDANGLCERGNASGFCGTGGVNCQSCAALGEGCVNQHCAGPDGGQACGWFNCGGCCDESGACIPVNSDTQCGGGEGTPCTDCAKLGDRCRQGLCVAPDGSLPCFEACALGCCDRSGNCQLGFLDTQCGYGGVACQDCTSLTPSSTCDLDVFPRTCASEQTVCPGPYSGCPAALNEPVMPLHQAVCATTDIEGAALACAGDGGSFSACSNVFNPDFPCADCLQSFNFTLSTQAAVHACAAPYLDAACSHSLACLDDCTSQACAGCKINPAFPADPDVIAQCDAQAQAGACSAYASASACLAKALDGPAAFCNPATYQGNYGAWLQAVGTVYCGQ